MTSTPPPTKSVLKNKIKDQDGSQKPKKAGFAPEPIEMPMFWGGSKLMWRTNETIMIRIYYDGEDFFQIMTGNSDTDEEYTPIMIYKSKIKIDESAIKRNIRKSQEQNWRLETEELYQQHLTEFYGNFIVSRLNFTARNDETGMRDLVLQKSASDEDSFNEIFATERPEHLVAPRPIEKPKRRTFEDFVNVQNQLDSEKKFLSRQTVCASKAQKAMQLSIDMLDALKYSTNNATGLRKLKLIALRGIFQKNVILYKERLATSTVYAEMLAYQEQMRIREEVISRKPSSIPTLPPISPRSQLISPRA